MPADIDNDAPSHASPRWIHWAGLFAGPALAVVTWLLLAPGNDAVAGRPRQRAQYEGRPETQRVHPAPALEQADM